MMDKEKNFRNPDEADEDYWGYLMAGAEEFEEPECADFDPDPWYDESVPGCPQEDFFDECAAAQEGQNAPEEAGDSPADEEPPSEEEDVIYARDDETLSQDPYAEVTYEDDAAFMARVQELSEELKVKNSLVCGDFPNFGPQPAYFANAASKLRFANFKTQEEADKAFAEITRKLWFDYHRQFPKYKETEETAQWFDIVFGESCAKREKYYETAAIRQFNARAFAFIKTPLQRPLPDKHIYIGREPPEFTLAETAEDLSVHRQRSLKREAPASIGGG